MRWGGRMNVNLDFVAKKNNITKNPFQTDEDDILLRNLCYEFFSDTEIVCSYNPFNCHLEDKLSHHYKIRAFFAEINYFIMWKQLSEHPEEVVGFALKYAEGFRPKMINEFSQQISEVKSWSAKSAITLLCELTGRYNPVSKIYDPYKKFDLTDLNRKLKSIVDLRLKNIDFQFDDGKSGGEFAFCNNVNLMQVDKTMSFLSRYDNWFFITNLNKKLFSKMNKNKILLLNNNYYPVDNIKKCKKIMFFNKK